MDDEVFVRTKRISPFLNTPKQRKDDRRRLLRMSCMKLRRIEDPEQCLLRSVLIHNTAKQLENELCQNGSTTLNYWDAYGLSRWDKPEKVFANMSKPGKLFPSGQLSCEYEILNNSYLYTNAHLFVDNYTHDSDLDADELSKALERTIDNYKSSSEVERSESRQHGSHGDAVASYRATAHDTISSSILDSDARLTRTNGNVSNSNITLPSNDVSLSRSNDNSLGVTQSGSVIDFEHFAAQLTGAPIFTTGSITRGIPRHRPSAPHYPAPCGVIDNLDTVTAGPLADEEHKEVDVEQLTETGDENQPLQDMTSQPDGDIGVNQSQDEGFIDLDLTCRKRAIGDSLESFALPVPCAVDKAELQPNVKRLKGHEDKLVITDAKASIKTAPKNSYIDNSKVGLVTNADIFASSQLAKSAVTLVSFSQDLDSFMSDYVCQAGGRRLSCGYMRTNGESTGLSASPADSRDVASQTLVPVLSVT